VPVAIKTPANLNVKILSTTFKHKQDWRVGARQFPLAFMLGSD